MEKGSMYRCMRVVEGVRRMRMQAIEEDELLLRSGE
jgi:hypothetical protein